MDTSCHAQEVFQTEALTFGDLVYIFCLTSSLIVLDTIRKIVFRPVSPSGGEYPEYGLSQAWQRVSMNFSGPGRRKKATGKDGGGPSAFSPQSETNVV